MSTCYLCHGSGRDRTAGNTGWCLKCGTNTTCHHRYAKACMRCYGTGKINEVREVQPQPRGILRKLFKGAPKPRQRSR
ncbi:DnaJ-class molecular chaperone [Actinoplanes octamycinicus]|uniref:DnaJ-class molecular chaperone n=1 Tax=Actinoplanes octamycinicus TaxID=135948 RepID=A0A7W7MAF1_9ACTN|nr:DnaJ-class molecular chaperone [Actinoplanes octamycinicus]